jgi:hypothetical protein
MIPKGYWFAFEIKEQRLLGITFFQKNQMVCIFLILKILRGWGLLYLDYMYLGK